MKNINRLSPSTSAEGNKGITELSALKHLSFQPASSSDW